MHSVNEGYGINTQPQPMARDSVVHGNAESHPKMFKVKIIESTYIELNKYNFLSVFQRCEICRALMHSNSSCYITPHCPRNRMNHKK
jgi:hypothetical protein